MKLFLEFNLDFVYVLQQQFELQFVCLRNPGTSLPLPFPEKGKGCDWQSGCDLLRQVVWMGKHAWISFRREQVLTLSVTAPLCSEKMK